jgi:hypothetical protein
VPFMYRTIDGKTGASSFTAVSDDRDLEGSCHGLDESMGDSTDAALCPAIRASNGEDIVLDIRRSRQILTITRLESSVFGKTRRRRICCH